MILNVTPEEYFTIKEAGARLSEGDFIWFMRHWFSSSLPLYEEIKVVVRRDVPSVPWFSKGVERVEK